jgi:hypothetical protein
MINVRSFIHGNAIVAERVGGGAVASPGPLTNVQQVPWSDVVGLPQGWGKTYRGRSDQLDWFHAAIPTPGFTFPTTANPDGGSTYLVAGLQRAFIFFNATDGCFISDIHFWDGIDVIQLLQSQHISGNHPREEEGVNTFNPRDSSGVHSMAAGLGISVGVHFAREADITFFSAGAEFGLPRASDG